MNPVGLWRRATATEFDSTDEEDIESEDELAMDLSLSEDDDDDEDDVSQYPMGQNGPVPQGPEVDEMEYLEFVREHAPRSPVLTEPEDIETNIVWKVWKAPV